MFLAKSDRRYFAVRLIQPLALALVLASLSVICGCGSGGGGGTVPPPPPVAPGFMISVSPNPVAITAGGTSSVSVSVSSMGGFNDQVSVTVTGLPPGVSVSPSSLNLSLGKSQEFMFSANRNLYGQSVNLQLRGTADTYRSGAALTLNVTPYSGPIAFPRSGYVRTDAATDYGYWPNQIWIVYNSPTNRFFVTDPTGNRVMAIDASTRREVGVMIVPGAYGIDETPDHTALYVGTQIGDVYVIDPVAMKVTKRYVASQIGPNGYQAYMVHVLADGRLVLVGGQGGVPMIDGYAGYVVWNPADNSLIDPKTQLPAEVADACNAFGGNDLVLTGDRALIVTDVFVDWVPYEGTGVCTFDPVSGKVSLSPFSATAFTTTADGKSIVVKEWSPGPHTPTATFSLIDARTFATTTSFQVPSEMQYFLGISADSKTAYLADLGFEIVHAFDFATGQPIGWFPNLSVPWIPEVAQAPLGTGLMAGPAMEGVGFLDTSVLQTGPVGQGNAGGLCRPATGPAGGGTTVGVAAGERDPAGLFFFGANRVESMSTSSDFGSFGSFSVVTPPGEPGPVDVYETRLDGSVLVFPEVFSYGPTILEVTPNSSVAGGGGTGVVYGYGFGPNTPGTTSAPGLHVAVGGKVAIIVGYSPYAYQGLAAPFPLQAVYYVVPAGVAGQSADVTVTSTSGTTTLAGGMHYLPAAQKFSLPGASLIQGVYDSLRDLYYFTDVSEIRVFSKTAGQWQTSIQVPAAPNGTTHRLWGIALSPDRSKLAVSDHGSGMIYVIDPGSGATTQAFSVTETYFAGRPLPGTDAHSRPAGLAIGDSGTIYYTVSTEGGFDALFKLDSGTGQITDYGMARDPSPQMRVVITKDNSRVFFNDRSVLGIDTATDEKFTSAVFPVLRGPDYELALSGDNSTLAGNAFLFDTGLNAESYLALNWREGFDVTYVYGAKLSADGRLLFQPSTNGIDVFDGRLGTYRDRVALPFALSQNYDALVSDGTDNVLIAITGQNGDGIAVVDLRTLAVPDPLPYEAEGNSHGGLALFTRHAAAASPATRAGASQATRKNSASAAWLGGGRPIRHVTNDNSPVTPSRR